MPLKRQCPTKNEEKNDNMKNLNNIQKSFIVVIVTTIAFAFIYYVPFEPFYEFRESNRLLSAQSLGGWDYYGDTEHNIDEKGYSIWVKLQKVPTRIALILIASLTSFFLFKSKK